MKRSLSRLLTLCLVLLGLTACGHVDLSRESDPNRVVTGTVNVRMNLMPPPDSQILVRIVEPPDVGADRVAAGKDLVIGERGTGVRPERVVAEQAIRAPASMPVPFRLEFLASDAALRRGLIFEARMLWGGRVRFRMLETQVLTLDTVAQPQTVWLEPVR